MARSRSVVFCAIALLCGTRALADAYDYRVLLDTDRNPATGCGVPVKDANINTTVAGVDQLIIIHVQRTSPFSAQVVGVGRQACVSGSFEPEVSVAPGGWPVGLNDGFGGADVVEGFVQRGALGDSGGFAQVAFSSTKVGGNSDVLLTTNGQASGGPLLFDFLHAAPAPAMRAWSVGVALLLLGLIAYGALRRYPRTVRLGVVALILAIGGMVMAQVATIIPDGAVDDWGTIAPLGRDAIHDTTSGDDAEDIVQAFMAQDNDNVYFRVDLLNVIDPASTRTPTATNTPAAPVNGSTQTATATQTATTTATPTETPTSSPTPTVVDCANPGTDGIPCNDGNLCRSGAMCQSGSCSGGTFVICPPSISQCTSPSGSCDSSTGHCVYPPVQNGTSCNDGNACTGLDSCQNGSCVGSPVICTPDLIPPQCRQAVKLCNPQDGQCLNTISADGIACDDGNACTTGDTCTAGVCSGAGCPAGKTCCSQSAPCVDPQSDSSNCGSCGHACVSSICFQGTCFPGCVISGVAYNNGTLNPGNPCQVCDVSQSRTAWTNLGQNFPNPPTSTCNLGCFSGFCDRGACATFGEIGAGSGCGAASSCETAICNQNGVCVHTPTNENGSCTPALSTSACRSSSSGVCHSGDCVPTNINEGQSCAPIEQSIGDNAACRSSVNGHCDAGTCTAVGLLGPCHPNPSDLCEQGACGLDAFMNPSGFCIDQNTRKTCSVPDGCGSAGTCDAATGICTGAGPFPSFGQRDCGNLGTGPEPDQCCPGQACICPPTGNEFNTTCFFFGCWNPADVPSGALATASVAGGSALLQAPAGSLQLGGRQQGPETSGTPGSQGVGTAGTGKQQAPTASAPPATPAPRPDSPTPAKTDQPPAPAAQQ